MFSKPYLWHPIFVHFSVALLTVGSVFYILAAVVTQARYRDNCIRVGQWNLGLGIGFTVLTVGFGFVAYATVPHDDASHEALKLHRDLALVTTGLYGVLGIWAYLQRSTKSRVGRGLALGLFIALVSLVATAFLGGHLVFERGLGVQQSLTPNAIAGEAPEHRHGPHDSRAHDHDTSGDR